MDWTYSAAPLCRDYPRLTTHTSLYYWSFSYIPDQHLVILSRSPNLYNSDPRALMTPLAKQESLAMEPRHWENRTHCPLGETCQSSRDSSEREARELQMPPENHQDVSIMQVKLGRTVTKLSDLQPYERMTHGLWISFTNKMSHSKDNALPDNSSTICVLTRLLPSLSRGITFKQVIRKTEFQERWRDSMRALQDPNVLYRIGASENREVNAKEFYQLIIFMETWRTKKLSGDKRQTYMV